MLDISIYLLELLRDVSAFLKNRRKFFFIVNPVVV